MPNGLNSTKIRSLPGYRRKDEDVPKIGIVGGGAIGGLIAGHMTRNGVDVTLFDGWEENVQAISKNGILLDGVQGEHRVKVRIQDLQTIGSYHEEFDILVMAVKSYDTVTMVERSQHTLAKAGFIVSPQNGINEEQIAPIVGADRMLGCVTTLSAGLIGPGHVRQTGSTSQSIGSGIAFTLGELDGSLTERLRETVELWQCAGPSRSTENLWGERWCKLAINCMVNPTAAMTGLDNWEIRSNAQSRAIMFNLAAEAVRVGKSFGYQIPSPIGGFSIDDLNKAIVHGHSELEGKFVGSPPEIRGRPSLLQDVSRGRKTEIDYLNGYVVRRGGEIGVNCAYNQGISAIIRGIESGEFSQSLDNLTRLESLV